MSDTITDMAKVTAALDAGWQFMLYKNPMGSYTVECRHNDERQMDRLKRAGVLDEDGDCVTDDFTAAQAMTRAAYKAMEGRII